MRLAIAAAMIAAGSAHAAGYDDNRALSAFRDQACGITMFVIDGNTPIADGSDTPDRLYYFGFLVGFDTAAGGLSTDTQTTLARLRETCAADPTRPALDILQEFATARPADKGQ